MTLNLQSHPFPSPTWCWPHLFRGKNHRRLVASGPPLQSCEKRLPYIHHGPASRPGLMGGACVWKPEELITEQS